MSPNSWQQVTDIIADRAPHCRGVVMLGLDAPPAQLQASFDNSAGFDICKGFTVGRTIFSEPSRQWLSNTIDDQQLIDAVAENYIQLIGFWRNRKAR
jgi:5-dehydro-2-deoxygluconokinase